MLRQYEIICLLFSPTVVGRSKYAVLGEDERQIGRATQFIFEQLQEDIGNLPPQWYDGARRFDIISGNGGSFKVLEPYE